MVRPSTGGPSGPPQAHDRGSDSSRSPRNRLRLAMPSANSAENPAMTRSGRPSLRRPAGVNASCSAVPARNGPAVVTCGSSRASSARPWAGSRAAKMVNRAYLSELYPRASRPWMSSRSSFTATVASQQREPVPDLCGAHVASQAGPDLGVVLDVGRAERGIGRVPHRHGHLASTQDIFKRLFVRGSAPQQPAGRRVADGVAERGVQPPPDLVDEVVVIGLDGAVVVAGEGHPPPAVERYPAGEMDGLDPGKVGVVVPVPHRVVDGEHHGADGHPPQPPGLMKPTTANGFCVRPSWCGMPALLAAGHSWRTHRELTSFQGWNPLPTPRSAGRSCG